MKQIDILISDQQKEYLEKEQSLRTQLQRQERELSTMRVTVQEKNAEVWISEAVQRHPMYTISLQLERMKLQNNGSAKHQVAFYEAQVSKLRAEVSVNYKLHTSHAFLLMHQGTGTNTCKGIKKIFG